MDRKSFIVLLVSFLLLMLWYPLTNRLFPPTQLPPTTNAPTRATNQPKTSAPPASTNLESPSALTLPNTPAPTPARAETPEETLVIENENARYTFSSHGGGLKLAELKRFPATVDCNVKKKPGSNTLATLNAPARTPVLSVMGGEALEGDGVFKLSRTTNSVRAEKLLTNGLLLVKEFQLSTNYLLKTSVRLENKSPQPITLPVQEWVLGTATPIGRRDESLHLGFQWYNGTRTEDVGESWFANRGLGCGVMPSNPRNNYVAGSSNVFWASVHNQFFALIAVPADPAPNIVARRVLLLAPSPEELAADSKALAQPYGYQVGFLYPGMVLPANGRIERRFEVYAGPKEYNTLARLGNNLDLVMKFGFFGFFAKALLLSMNGLHELRLPYGMAIVVITVIIKLVFWPLTKASTRSMKRMAALQPQMKAIQEKYKEDPRKMNQKLMEFMKENRVSPLGGCLPMMLQIPVFIGFYTMLQSAIELRGAQFLWACDLSRADTIWIIPGLNFPLNPMPLMMGATMLWQARLTPPSPGMDPVQQKIMKYMPLMFMVFLYNFSAGLTLYWTVQNLLTIAQMKLTKSSDPESKPGPKPLAPAPKGPVPKKKKE